MVPVSGFTGPWPEMNTKPLATTAWEYGPAGAGPFSAMTVFLIYSPFLSLCLLQSPQGYRTSLLSPRLRGRARSPRESVWALRRLLEFVLTPGVIHHDLSLGELGHRDASGPGLQLFPCYAWDLVRLHVRPKGDPVLPGNIGHLQYVSLHLRTVNKEIWRPDVESGIIPCTLHRFSLCFLVC